MVALLLLAPAVLTFGIDHVQRKQTAMLGARGALPCHGRRRASTR